MKSVAIFGILKEGKQCRPANTLVAQSILQCMREKRSVGGWLSVVVVVFFQKREKKIALTNVALEDSVAIGNKTIL